MPRSEASGCNRSAARMARCSSLSGPKGPEVVAGVIAMLASEDGAHVNGEDIRVDGATLS